MDLEKNQTFICDIITDFGNLDVDLEHILIKAPNIDDALAKLNYEYKFKEYKIIEMTENRILLHAELENNTIPRHIIIEKPLKIIE